MNKIFRFIAILLSIVLIVGIAGCSGKSKTSKSKSVIQEASAQESIPASKSVSTAPASPVDPEDIPVQLRVLPNDFGRDNPFVPLAGADSKGKKPTTFDMDQEKRLMPPKTAIKKSEPSPLPNVRLSLAIDGNTAIFEDNKVSKVASVGDTVSGMKVLEIRGNEAVLSSGTKKFVVTQGGVREESPAPAVPVQNNNVPKNPKKK